MQESRALIVLAKPYRSRFPPPLYIHGHKLFRVKPAALLLPPKSRSSWVGLTIKRLRTCHIQQLLKLCRERRRRRNDVSCSLRSLSLSLSLGPTAIVGGKDTKKVAEREYMYIDIYYIYTLLRDPLTVLECVQRDRSSRIPRKDYILFFLYCCTHTYTLGLPFIPTIICHGYDIRQWQYNSFTSCARKGEDQSVSLFYRTNIYIYSY